MKIFLDDIRSIPSDYIEARCYEESIRHLNQNKGKITVISLDYHLDELRNGMNVCEWIVNTKYFKNVEIIESHTNDQRAAKKMMEYLDKNVPSNIKLQYFDERREIIEYKREY